jgi:ABC-type glycerol-3-phosphate transport system permease component
VSAEGDGLGNALARYADSPTDSPDVLEGIDRTDPLATSRVRGWGTAVPRFWELVATVALSGLALVTLAPLAIALIGSLEPSATSASTGFTFSNWAKLFGQLPIGSGFRNSAILALGGTALTLAVAPLAGFAFAKLAFPGSQLMLYLVIGTLLVPMVSIIIPEFVNLAHLHLVDSYPSTILLYTALNTGFCVFLYTAYFRNMPDALVEAALVDGASYLQTYIRVALPVAIPAIITGGVLVFIGIWNDFLIALLFMPRQGHETINVVLATVNSQHIVETHLLLAGSLLSIVPTLVAYLVFQRYLINGFALTAEK